MKKTISIVLLVLVGCGGPVPVLEQGAKKVLSSDIPPDEQLTLDIPPDEQLKDIPPDEQLTGDAGTRKPPVCVNCFQ
jgi:hypothetical protein